MSCLEPNAALDVEEMPDGLRVVLRASHDAVDAAAAVAEAFLGRRAENSALFDVVLILREALLNAVVHGCGLDAEKRVDVRITLEGDQAVIVVADPGPGFAWRDRPPCLPGVCGTSGRGLCIMDLYALSMGFNDAGNILTLRVGLQRPDGRNGLEEGNRP